MKYAMFFLFFSISISNAIAQDKGIQFEKSDWETVLAKAKEENKLIFVDCYTDWCGPCKWMDKNVFKDEKVGAFYNDQFINFKMNMEKGEGPKFARKYKIRAYPTLLFIDGNGKVQHSDLGMKRANDFLKLGKKAAKKS